jgi:PhoH-like ATPase
MRASPAVALKVKYFVIDTNVILHDAEALHAFKDNAVIIPIDVIEELDKFKSQNDELGRNAREAIRILDRLRMNGNLGEGVLNPTSGGTVAIDMHPGGGVPGSTLALGSPDNRILSVAVKLHREGKPVTFVSKDMNMRIKADALGVRVADFEKEKVNIDRLYRGWREVQVASEDIEDLRAGHAIEVGEDLFPNELALVRNCERAKQTLIGRRGRSNPRELVPLKTGNDRLFVNGVEAKNLEQRMALELLLDDDVPLVTLIGKAGTGKTLLALAAAMQKTIKDEQYEKILVSRPIMPLGRDIGYLPGTKDEKLEPWMKPIFDNLKIVLREKERAHQGGATKKVQELLKSGMVEMEALTYIRGRSIYDQFVIVDEAQNLTPHEVKTIISRAGDETKLILTGDPYQIDNPYLDANSNGLSYVAERMKEQEVAGHVILTKTERSPLASVAAEIL